MRFASKNDTIAVKGVAATYTVRVPTKREAIELVRRIRAAGGRMHAPQTVLARTRYAVAAAFAADAAECARLCAVLDEYGAEYGRLVLTLGERFRDIVSYARAASADPNAPLPPALAALRSEAEAFAPLEAQYQRIRDLVEHLDPGLRDMLADNETYAAVHNLTAAEMFLAGAESAALPPFASVAGRASTAFVEAMPAADVAAVGLAVFRAMQPDETDTTNSASPPGVLPGGGSSTGESTGARGPQPPTETAG
jgi:hypothetical protein